MTDATPPRLVAATRGLRRRPLIGAAAVLPMLAAPFVVRAQPREIFIGGPASPGLTDVLFPLIERKHNFRILFEGTNSLINMEKIKANRARPTMTVTMMDDPVLILCERENLITTLNGRNIPNLADVIPAARPRASMWANWCQPMSSIAFNTENVRSIGSYAEMWDRKFRQKIILISMRITQAITPVVAAAHLVTGKPLVDCIREFDAGFEKLKELKPNILQVTSNTPQAQNLLETGEIDLFLSPDSRSVLFRKSQRAPVDMAVPREGVVAMPAGVALVTGGPNQALGELFINELLNPETQSLVARTFFSNPTNAKAVLPANWPLPRDMAVLDWEYFADNRANWIARFERELAV
jgi:putative spermidine/putrescine transport system substrate-binding protein